jgi:hypothetical protein
MSCHDARDWFSGWIDETLTVEEHAALAAHLAGCADCSRELGRFRATVALLELVERPRAPAGFAARVLDAVRPVPWHRRLVARLFLPLAVKLPAEAAAALLVAGLAVYLFKSTPVLQQAAREDASPPAARQQASPPVASAPSTAPLIAPSMQPSPTGPRSSSTARATAPSMPPPAAAPQMPSAPGVASSMPTPPVRAPSSPSSSAVPPSMPEPPAGVAPVESLPSAATEAPSKAESRGEATSGALGRAALSRTKELEKSAVAPLSPPGAASRPGAVSEAKKDTAAAGAPPVAQAPAPVTQAPEPRPAERPARISPVLEDRRDSPAEKAKRAPAQLPAGPRAAMNALPAADVTGRLTVKDRGAAESAVVDLVTRTGGTLVSRRADSDGTVMDVVVPRASYAEFSGGLGRIGAWLPQGEPAALPPDVRVTLRLAE